MQHRALACALFALVAAVGAACGGSTTLPPDAGAGAGSNRPFMATCDLGHSEECASMMCFDFKTKGPHCTHTCKAAGDCESPSPGCSGMGVCQAPGGGGGTGGGTGGSGS
jgi:hypothetical protein